MHKLTEIIKNHKVPLSEIARGTGFSYNSIHSYVNGKAKPKPEREIIIKAFLQQFLKSKLRPSIGEEADF